MTEVSVICVTYNQEKYICETIESLLNQKTSFSYEIIVHDDASTDQTRTIIQEYHEKYPDMIRPILQKENQFSQKKDIVREFIFPECKGKYIAFCEGDDYWCDENKLQKQYDFLETHPDYSACVHNTKMIDVKNGKESLKNPSREDKDIVIEDVIPGGGKEYHVSAVFFREQYKYRPQEFYTSGFGDYPRAIYLCYVGKMRYFADVMSVHRVNVDGSWTSRNVGTKDATKQIAHYKEAINFLQRVDQVTGEKYHDTVTKSIRWYECVILQWEDNAKKILTDYRDVYEGMSFPRKMIIRFKAYFPKLFNFLNQFR